MDFFFYFLFYNFLISFLEKHNCITLILLALVIKVSMSKK